MTVLSAPLAAVMVHTDAAAGGEVVATVSTGTSPSALAVDPITDQIYVVNQSSNDVTVIDGATNATTTVAAGTDPIAVAVNPTPT